MLDTDRPASPPDAGTDPDRATALALAPSAMTPDAGTDPGGSGPSQSASPSDADTDPGGSSPATSAGPSDASTDRGGAGPSTPTGLSDPRPDAGSTTPTTPATEPAVTPAAGEPGPGQWLAKLEAARLLGISERALERRLQRGELPRRRRADSRVEVYVATPPAQLEQALALAERWQATLLVAQAPLLARLETLAAELGQVRAERAQLRGQLEHTTHELETLRQAYAAARPARVSPACWWRRWWGALHQV